MGSKKKLFFSLLYIRRRVKRNTGLTRYNRYSQPLLVYYIQIAGIMTVHVNNLQTHTSHTLHTLHTWSINKYPIIGWQCVRVHIYIRKLQLSTISGVYKVLYRMPELYCWLGWWEGGDGTKSWLAAGQLRWRRQAVCWPPSGPASGSAACQAQK